MHYTVLLLYPDYINDGGEETYLSHVNTSDVSNAIEAARTEAMHVEGNEACENGEDFAVLMVVQGHVLDIKTQTK